MSKSIGLDRRTFMRNAGLTALAGATGTAATLTSTAAHGDPASIPLLAGGKYDFDTVYDRKGSNCSRWDGPGRRYPEGAFKYGMGVASMDFECAPCITEALTERVQHHSWGYMATTEPLREQVVKWNGERHGVDLDSSMVVLSDGVYPGVIAAMRSFVPRGNKVLITTPAYSGFYSMARAANIETVDSQMVRKNGRYEFDWEDLEAKMTADVRALILCNPQNPTGNVWTEEEMLRIGRLCLEHDIIVLSDEIHSDVVRSGHRYRPFASIPDEAVVNNSVTFNAISKTFNLAGMKNAYYYSKNPILLERVNKYHRAELSTLGVVANEAAYKHGADWFEQVNAYMDESHTFVENHLKQNMPDVVYTRNEGTFMTFMDFSTTINKIGVDELARMYGRETPERNFQDWLVHHSGVYLNPGSDYGTGGEGHMRVNIASARSVLKEALDELAAAIRSV